MDTIQKGEDLAEALRLMDGEVTVPFIVVESLLERHEQEKIRMREEHEKVTKRMKRVAIFTTVTTTFILLCVVSAIIFIFSTYNFRTIDVEQHTGDGGNNTYVGGDSYGNAENKNTGSNK